MSETGNEDVFTKEDIEKAKKDLRTELDKKYQTQLDNLSKALEDNKSKVDEKELDEFRKFKAEAEQKKLKGEEGTEEQVNVFELKLQKAEKEKLELVADTKAKLEEASKREEALIKKYALNDAVSKAKIPTYFQEAVKRLHDDKVLVVDGQAVVEDAGETIPVEKYLKAWVDTEEGSAFTLAPISSGGGATGGSKLPAKKYVDDKGKLLIPLSELMTLKKNDLDKYNKVISQMK